MKSYGVTIMNPFTVLLNETIQMRPFSYYGIICFSVCHKVKHEIFVNFDLAILNERVVVRNIHYLW